MSDSESIKNRVYQFIKLIGSNPNRFQESIGVSGTYLKTVKNIGADKIAKILVRYPEVNSEWLLTGQGEMLKLTSESTTNIPHTNNTDERIKKLELTIIQQDAEIKSLKNTIEMLIQTIKK